MLMMLSVINYFHNFFLSQMLQWCTSYQYVSITIWICLGVILYVLFLIFGKVIFKVYFKNRNGISEKICKSIENNNIVECIQLLSIYSDSINKYMENGYTPFQIACAYANTQIVKFMLKKGADIKIKSYKQESPFYLTTFYYIKHPRFKNATCIRELYYAGADINEPNDRGLTPLQLAAMFGHTSLVKWLLVKGASTKTIPSPFIIAITQGHQETANIIGKFSNGFAIDFK